MIADSFCISSIIRAVSSLFKKLSWRFLNIAYASYYLTTKRNVNSSKTRRINQSENKSKTKNAQIHMFFVLTRVTRGVQVLPFVTENLNAEDYVD